MVGQHPEDESREKKELMLGGVIRAGLAKPLAAWKPKSCCCIHGHTDPDTGSLIAYANAPTPQMEGMQLFVRAGILESGPLL